MMRSVWLRALLFASLWWVLAEGRSDGWLLGGIAVAAATWASVALWPPAAHGYASPHCWVLWPFFSSTPFAAAGKLRLWPCVGTKRRHPPTPTTQKRAEKVAPKSGAMSKSTWLSSLPDESSTRS